MGGQACVLYGAAQVSRDLDLLLLAEDENFQRLHEALDVLDAHRIAVPLFDPDWLNRGHAVAGDEAALREALDTEARREREADRRFWEPLKRELEQARRDRKP